MPRHCLISAQAFSTEGAFLRVATRFNRVPLFSSNLKLLTERGLLGDAWRLLHPNPADRLPLHLLDKVAL